MSAKEDIKWFELFIDIIFVAGLSKLINEVSINLDELTLFGGLNSLLLFLILFNIWIRIMMLENKIKVIERYLKTKIKKPIYKRGVFIQFVLTVYLIYFFNYNMEDGFTYFIFIYLLVTISNAYLYVIRPSKIIIVSILLFLSVTNISQNIITILFLIYIVYETYYTYKHLRTIANSIFRYSRFRPSILSEFNETDICILSYSNFRRKLYVPHLIERLGIIMIVFLAEYVLVMLTVLYEYENTGNLLLQSSLFISIVILFYYNFFSSIEHIDEKLVDEQDKRKKYRYGKISVYVIILYFISISALALLVKNFHYQDVDFSVLVIGTCGFALIQVADLILFTMYKEVKNNHGKLFYFLKILLVILVYSSLFLHNELFVLVAIALGLLLNVLIGKKLTKVEYSIH